MKKLNLLDLFSGIGGFHKGLEQAGFKVNSYFSEVDKHAISVYQNNFKKSTYVGSVTDVQGTQLPRINAITFGSPCQDFSIAGKRQGMDGKRSSLILEAIRLIRECRPDFFIWENVKGTFSSNNREDFAAILQAFANIGGYRLEWQLLNTKWFLPQNRERIYLVGYIGNRRGRSIFPIGTDETKIDVVQEQTTNTLTARYRADGTGSYIVENKLDAQIGDFRYDEGFRWRQNNISPTLTLNDPTYLKTPRIRRLTPIECERLQGFPDNWTKYDTNGEISDTQRYKMCGNAVTVNVVEAVANKIYKLYNK